MNHVLIGAKVRSMNTCHSYTITLTHVHTYTRIEVAQESCSNEEDEYKPSAKVHSEHEDLGAIHPNSVIGEQVCRW